MKKLLLLSALFCSLPAWATFSFVQEKHPTSSACSTQSCSLPAFNSTVGTGNIVIVFFKVGSGSVRVDVVTDDATGGSSTYTEATGARASDATGAMTEQIFYTLSTNAGATTISYHVNAGATTTIAGAQEFHSTGSSVAVDSGNATGAGVDRNTLATTQDGPALTINGTNDLIVQNVYFGSVTGISSSPITYTVTVPASPFTNYAYGYALNVTNGGAVTWTRGSGTARAVLGALAIAETTGGSSTPRRRVQVLE